MGLNLANGVVVLKSVYLSKKIDNRKNTFCRAVTVNGF
ncbi:hypothetical protein N44_03441 [Microcystis aeruginosa NIES-44]|uniref:Uncharacterized protein n=1 Tax=Microcystis aeruginosa NIES-44 TaxID=449439 RepID=A0A0A1VVR9_MICAE|nr:hypothetical protein N44_03441 [Microcystis aeruginosa NIES-44]